jgi:hypothetical protein
MNGLHIAKCISFLCWLFISCTLENVLIALISHMVVGSYECKAVYFEL